MFVRPRLGEAARRLAEDPLESGFSDKLGLAFQIRDDILDRLGTAEAMGKRAGKGRRGGRQTAAEILGLGGARQRSHPLAAECVIELDTFGSQADHLREIASFAVARIH